MIRKVNIGNKLWHNFQWLIWLRWSICALLFACIILKYLLSDFLIIESGPIVNAVIAIASVNTFFHLYHIYSRENYSSELTTEINFRYFIFFFSQVFFDYFLVTYLIIKYGFQEYNFASLYIPHIIISSIIFEKMRAGLIVLLASVVLTSIMIFFHHASFESLASNSPSVIILINRSVTFAVYNVGIFCFVFYLVNMLTLAITEGKRELVEMNRQLRALEKEKQTYTLRATHELKAPFAAIQSYAQLIIDGYFGPLDEKLKNVVVKIYDRCDSLSKMIKNIIQLSELRTTVLENSYFAKVDLTKTVTKCLRDFRPKLNDKKITLKSDFEETAEIVGFVNPGMIEVLISNLITNAVVYSPSGSEISVCLRVSEFDRQAVFSVKDQGIGIPEECHKKIFLEHFRCDNAVAYNSKGNGLGLAIVSEIVKLHKGSIVVKSALHQGAEFIIKIPLEDGMNV